MLDRVFFQILRIIFFHFLSFLMHQLRGFSLYEQKMIIYSNCCIFDKIFNQILQF